MNTDSDEVVFTHEVHIRRGIFVNDDPQRRCYNGCWYKSHWEWGEWEHWQDCINEEYAKRIVRLFKREDQQMKVVRKVAAGAAHG